MKFFLILLLAFNTGCLSMPKKKTSHLMKQDESFQKCRLLKIINENHILILVGEKMYVSKLSGLSTNIKKCHDSWSNEQVRQLKILHLEDMIRWRADNYNFYLLDVSDDKDYSQILMVSKDLTGFANLTRLTIGKGGAVFDESYKGPYWQNMKKANEVSKNTSNGIYGKFDKELFQRMTLKGFNLKEYPIDPPIVIGEWTPNAEQREILEEEGVIKVKKP